MHLDEHLVQTFYLSRPQQTSNSPRNKQQSLQKHQQRISQSTQLHRGSQTMGKDEKLQYKNKNQHKKILKMITNKMAPSTAVNTPITINKIRQSKTQSTQKFIALFEEFFRGFIENEGLNNTKDESLREKKQEQHRSQVKKVGIRMKSLETNRLQSFEDDDESFVQRLREKNRKLTYHQRIKQQIDYKIDSILTRKEFKKHQVKLGHNYTKSNVEKGLWIKTIGKHADLKLRMTKTGLPFHLSQPDQKQTQKHSKMMQREKAKKDRLFQKSLTNNNVITLNSIQNYHNKIHIKKEQKKVVLQKQTIQSHCLKDTRITQNRKKMLVEKMRRSCDDLQHLKLRQKCLQIEWDCDQSRNNYKQISKGLKVFEGFNGAMATILNLKAKTITKIMADENNSKRNTIQYFEDHYEK